MKNIYICLLLTVVNFSVMSAEPDKTKIGKFKVSPNVLNAQDHNSTRSNRGQIKAPVEKNNQNVNTSNVLNAQDHNSTRSNRGSIKAPVEENQQNSNTTSVKNGRNPQTGKEINIKRTKD